MLPLSGGRRGDPRSGKRYRRSQAWRLGPCGDDNPVSGFAPINIRPLIKSTTRHRLPSTPAIAESETDSAVQRAAVAFRREESETLPLTASNCPGSLSYSSGGSTPPPQFGCLLGPLARSQQCAAIRPATPPSTARDMEAILSAVRGLIVSHSDAAYRISPARCRNHFTLKVGIGRHSQPGH